MVLVNAPLVLASLAVIAVLLLAAKRTFYGTPTSWSIGGFVIAALITPVAALILAFTAYYTIAGWPS